MDEKQTVIVTSVFPPEPVVSAKISLSLAKALALKSKVIVVCPYPTRPKGYNFKSLIMKSTISDNFQIKRVKSFTFSSSNAFGRLFESISFGLASYRFISKQHKFISKVYINSWPLFAQYLTALACKRNNINYIIHVQDIYPESLINKIKNTSIKKLLFKLLFPLDEFVLKKAHKIIAISKKMKDDLIISRNIDFFKIEIVVNWQKHNKLIYRPNKPNPIFKFMYLGNIGPVAGVQFLIKSFYNAKLENAQLIIAGSGSKKSDCEELTKKLKTSNVIFMNVPDGKVEEIQSEADILLLPIIKGAATSSVPSKLISYMYSSKPILATIDNDSETFSVITDANAGWCGPAEDEEWLANKMKKLLSTEKKILIDKGKNGYNYASSNFDEETNLSKLLLIMQDF